MRPQFLFVFMLRPFTAQSWVVSTIRIFVKTFGVYVAVFLTMTMFAAAGFGQSTYSWNDTGSTWDAAGDWMTVAGPGGSFPGTSDIAQFTGRITSLVVDPVLGVNTTISQLRFAGSPTEGWNLSGSGTLAAGSATVSGIVTGGAGNYTIDLGTGSGVSLALSGPTTTAGGALVVGSGSLRLSGNTIASISGLSSNTVMSIRSGTLILDNSAGNPSSRRLSTSGIVALNGGGSTLEFRGASSGSTFNGMTGKLAASGAGDTYLRTVQNGTGSLAISFASVARQGGNNGTLLVENIGSGYVGDPGKPTVTFPTTPTLQQGIISSTPTNTIPWVAVTNRSSASSTHVTGRWANYDGGIVAASTNAATGDFSVASYDGKNVLFNPNDATPVTLLTPTRQLASVVLEPAVSGVTLNVGTGLNTFGLMLSGSNSITVNGTKLFSAQDAGRAIVVLDANAALSTNGSLNIVTTSTATVIGGNGFVILTGSSNQIDFNTTLTGTAAASLNLGGGVLRGTAGNLKFSESTKGVRLNLRGGVLEYDVSDASATFNLGLGKGKGQVNWTDFAGLSATTNVGGGGFSAYSEYSTDPARTLTVNIGGNLTPTTLFWNDSAATNPQLFITDGYALKFGSVRSNATVLWQNPIRLDGNSDGSSSTIFENRVREFSVTRGVGNAADQTQLNGLIDGSPSTDFLKTGTGVLVLTNVNTYQGNTFVNAGELRVSGHSGSRTGSGAVLVRSGGMLGGDGNALGVVSILAGGTIRGGDGTGVNQTLTTGNLTLYDNTTIRAVVANGTGSGSNNVDIEATGASLITAAAFGRSNAADTIDIELTNDGSLTLDGTTSYTRRLVSYTGLATNLSNGTYTSSSPDFTVAGSNFVATPGWMVLVDTGTLDVTFSGTPTPEPACILLLCGTIMGLGGVIRRRIIPI